MRFEPHSAPAAKQRMHGHELMRHSKSRNRLKNVATWTFDTRELPLLRGGGQRVKEPVKAARTMRQPMRGHHRAAAAARATASHVWWYNCDTPCASRAVGRHWQPSAHLPITQAPALLPAATVLELYTEGQVYAESPCTGPPAPGGPAVYCTLAEPAGPIV